MVGDQREVSGLVFQLQLGLVPGLLAGVARTDDHEVPELLSLLARLRSPQSLVPSQQASHEGTNLGGGLQFSKKEKILKIFFPNLFYVPTPACLSSPGSPQSSPVRGRG